MTDNRIWMTNDTQLSYRVSNGIPNQLQMSLSPFQNDGRAGWHAGFVQEQWSHGKLTLQGALRFDHAGQLVPRADARTVEVLPEPDRLPGNEGRGQLQGLHARAWASPTTCSATAGRR